MKIGMRNLAVFVVVTALVVFISMRFDPNPYSKSIFAAVACAIIFYYSVAQTSAVSLKTISRETFSRKIMTPVFFVFLLFFFFDLFTQKINVFVSAAGIAIAIIGAFFYARSILFLAEFFSIDVEIKAKHKLVIKGPFGVVRHPAYASAFLIYAGMTLVANSIACSIMLLLAILPWTFYRIKIEEEVLSEEFGKEFEGYKKKVPALVPKTI